ncbi:CHAT domain-containing protein [Streptomyces sp. VB1]|uniref:CHAT domain-containing protein n=1 Tax=Streptomyces sp. VB1 TaxID=2986803 RepID=UPI002241CE3C|nr:CHAT domain-containing protein [Streptomyces sp. VB1]UZI27008.1 CHAT domain-containing protein [Streptomyces sp. VB1]
MPGATVLVGADATRDAVLDALPSSGWAHFACHGYSDPDNPSDSHLALHDHDRAPFRVLDFSRLRLRNAEFAFLSACDTARYVAVASAPWAGGPRSRLCRHPVRDAGTGGCIRAGPHPA